jgi:3-hydroxymyristoyl/3-hydroxydecanoyl-(acyl carrier protein) dehydratase
MTMTAAQIAQILRIQPPMLMLDGVTAIEPQKMCKAYKKVTAEEFWVKAHYPDEPIMPGMLQIEALIQAVAIPILYKPSSINQPTQDARCPILLVSVDKCRFYQPVTPGDWLDISVNIDRFILDIAQAPAQGMVNGKLVCEARISYKLLESPAIRCL